MGKWDILIGLGVLGAVAIFGYFGFRKLEEAISGFKLPSILPTIPEVTLPELLIPTVEQGGVVIPPVADIPSVIFNIPSAITPPVEGQPFFYSPTLSWITEGINNLLNPPSTPSQTAALTEAEIRAAEEAIPIAERTVPLEKLREIPILRKVPSKILAAQHGYLRGME